jgi:hypothetical protein
MAYKIAHRSRTQELRFPNQTAAEQYVDQFGGDPKHWSVTLVAPLVTKPARNDHAVGVESS